MYLMQDCGRKLYELKYATGSTHCARQPDRDDLRQRWNNSTKSQVGMEGDFIGMYTKLQGVYNLRDKWVHELRSDSKIVTKKVDTAVNISDVLTKCLSSVTRNALFMQVDSTANGLRNGHVRHLGRFDNRRIEDRE